jgi:hypothetical protein
MRAISIQTTVPVGREFQKRESASHLRKIIARLRKAAEIPTGYQDETGFHFGVEPAEKEVR